MATVYSLICWGGRTGKSVAGDTATDIITSTTHGLRTGTALVAQSTVSGVTSGTTYYANSIAANTFYLYDTLENAQAGGATGRIDITATTAFVLKSKATIGYLASPPTPERWGAAGSERCYDGITSWAAARAAVASYFDKEAGEIGEAFTEIQSSYCALSIPAQFVELYAINNARHNGVVGAGYVLQVANTNYTIGSLLLSCRSAVNGFTVITVGAGGGLRLNFVGAAAEQMIVQGDGLGTANPGLIITVADTRVRACLFTGFKYGVSVPNTQQYLSIANCTFTKNGIGFYTSYTTNVFGFFYNNLSVGNLTANWSAIPAGISSAGGNAGESGDTVWVTGANTTVIAAESDFADYAAGDYRPALSSSPQVDSGATYYAPYGYDIAGDETPNYNNGGSEAVDIGCYEFDNGFGPHPASHVLTLTNVVIGSRVHVSDQAGTVVHYDDIAASSTVVITQTVYGDTRDNWRIRVRKASDSPAYQPYETLMTATAGSSSIYVSQIQDE